MTTQDELNDPELHQNACLRSLQDLLIQGFENPYGRTGACLLRLTKNGPDLTMTIRLDGKILSFPQSPPNDPAAQVTLPLATVQRIITEVETLDFRDPDIVGHVRFDGDLELINLISKSLLRPSTDARERLEYATQRQSFAYGVSEVKRVEQASEFEILEALDEGRPMIITEPALMSSRDTWTLDALAAQYGEVPLRVRSADQRQTVAEFIAELQNKDRSDLRIIEGHTKAYTEGCALPSAMRPDFVPGYFSLHDYIEPQIWLGSVPTDVPASSLHRDPLDGFLFQIIGRKRLVLYSPDQAPLLYSSKAWNNYQPCWVSPNSPDYQRFPDFREARRLEVVLQPGELLVQPAGWFHEVSCLDSPTFSVSYFYRH